jgi:hypothetical protein
MKYTEEEAKALLKVMGFEVMSVPEWRLKPDCYFRYSARSAGSHFEGSYFYGSHFNGDTYNELLDYYFLREKVRERREKREKV